MVKTRVRFAGGSDAGRVRRNNEDAWHADADRGIFLVVDGIGGQNAGERAAAVAVERVRARLERQTGTTEQRIREAITMANNEILRAAGENPAWEGMACVLTLVVIENGTAVAGHVGDSRLYKVRRRQMQKLTHDHSPVGEREDSHELSEAEAMRHPRRNEVFRDVGSEQHAPDDERFIEIVRFPFEPDSALLLCSDGLSDQVPSESILRAVERHAQHPDKTVEELIQAANRAGGKDNVTVLVIEGEQFAAPAEAVHETPRSSKWPWVVLGLALLAALGWLAWRYLPELLTPKTITAVQTPSVRTVGPGQPFLTIAAALAEARPGDTVDVLPGDYREQVAMKTGVTIRSRSPREAALRASGGPTLPAVLADNVKDARLTGFKILADAGSPLATGIVLNNAEVEIDDNEIAGAGVGIEIRGSANPIVRANSIHDSLAEGVLIVGPSTPRLAGNAIRRNKGAGIGAREGAKPVLSDNLLEKNAGDPGPGRKLR